MDGIDLGSLELRTVGRPKAPLVFVEGRELTPADIERTKQAHVKPAESGLRKVHARHHTLAKYLVSGMPEGDAAVMAGYTGAYLSSLKSDPAFQELLVFYANSTDAKYDEMHEFLGTLGKEAVRELLDRMETKAEDFSNTALLEIMKAAADRSGHGPSTTATVNHKHDISSRLEAARKRLVTMREAEVIDVTAKEIEND